MVRYRLISILILVGLLLVLFLGSIGISARAQELQPAEPTPPFKEPFPIEREVPVSGTIQDVKAPDASGVYTNVLGTGDGNIHGLIYHDGYLWACTRTSPARVLQISPATLSVVSRATLTYNNAEDIIAVDYDENGNYYLWVVLRTSPARLVRVNPADMTTVVHELTGMNSGTAIWYAFDKLWVGGWDNIVEVDISDPDNVTFDVHDFSGLRLWNNVVTASIRADLSYLYVAFLQRDTSAPDGYRGTTIARIDPSNPTVGYLPQYVINDHPDDMVFTNDNLYTSGEDWPDPSIAYRFPISLTTYITNTIASSASYGVFHTSTDPESLWGAYIGSPGVVTKFDLDLDPVWTFNLPSGFIDPSEIVFDDNGNMYVSTWQNPSGIVEYTIPDAVTVSISKSGNDAVLSWNNTDSLVDHYEIWRSTDPYFTPQGNTPYATVTAAVGTNNYTDIGALGDVNNNYFYVVRAFNDFGLLSPISNRVGEFDRELRETTGSDFNWIGLPLNANLSMASSLATHIQNNSSGALVVAAIEQWNPIGQNYQTFIPPSSGDFPLIIGGVYRVSVDVTAGSSVIWSLLGSVPQIGSYSYNLYETTGSDLNWIMLPLHKNLLSMASGLKGDIDSNATPQTTVLTIENWNVVGQNFQTFVPPSGDFSIRIGYPYRITVDVTSGVTSTWP